MKRTFLILAALVLAYGTVNAAQLPVAVGTEETPVNLDTNFSNIQANMTELYNAVGAITDTDDQTADEVDDTSTTNKFTDAAGIAKLANVPADTTTALGGKQDVMSAFPGAGTTDWMLYDDGDGTYSFRAAPSGTFSESADYTITGTWDMGDATLVLPLLTLDPYDAGWDGSQKYASQGDVYTEMETKADINADTTGNAATATTSVSVAGGTVQVPSSTTLPATCTVGQLYVDTDADTDGTLYICSATDTWKDVDDDGVSGGMETADIDTSSEIATIVGDETGSGLLVFGTAPALSNPTGLDSNDVGLGNVDNTSNATERAASATLTNKTLDNDDNAFNDMPYYDCFVLSDETTDLTTGTAKLSFRAPFAFTLTDVRINAVTAPTGATLIVDLNEGGTTVLSTKATLDISELTSVSAAVQPVVSDTAIADDALMTWDIDQIGSTVAGAGLKACVYGKRDY